MKITMYAREGQTHCFECGSKFDPDGLPNAIGIVSTTCKKPGCNRGSWLQLKQNRDFCVPVEISLPDLPLPWKDLPAACLGSYRLGLNPLPKIRGFLPGIAVKYFIDSPGTGYCADEPTLAVWVGYDENENPDYVRVELHIADRIVWSAETDNKPPAMHLNETHGPSFLQNDGSWVSRDGTYWSRDIGRDHARECPHPTCRAWRLHEIP